MEAEKLSIKIGSFNLYKFHAYQSDDEIRKDLITLTRIISDEQFDIIAFQEIFSESALSRILTGLGRNWDGRWAKPNSHSVQLSEGYAFIWEKNKFKLSESLTSSGRRTYSPRIYNQYRINKIAGQQELTRNPFFARFESVNGFFEIRLINAHIMFSKSAFMSETDNLPNDVVMRKNELDILIKNIYVKESDQAYGTNRPAYTVLLGDYNLNLNREWTKSPYLEEVVIIQDGNGIKKIRNIQDQLTTLKNKSLNNPDEPVREFANNYDHFTYDENRFSDVGVRTARINSVEKYCQDDFEKHRKEISDHVPIKLELTINTRR